MPHFVITPSPFHDFLFSYCAISTTSQFYMYVELWSDGGWSCLLFCAASQFVYIESVLHTYTEAYETGF